MKFSMLKRGLKYKWMKQCLKIIFFLNPKNENKIFLPKVFTAKEHTPIHCFMYQDDSSLVYIVTFSWTYNCHITAI